MTRSKLIAGGALLLALAGGGCSKDVVIDREQWRADLAAAGAPSADLDRLEPLARANCDLEDRRLESLVAVALDESGESGLLQLRVNFRNLCPEEEGRLDEAVAAVEEASSGVQAACDTPASLRTKDQQQLAEAMSCD